MQPAIRHFVPAPFARILCAIDGSLHAHEAVRQALTLAGPDVELTFLAVAQPSHAGSMSASTLPAAKAALEAACHSAREAGVAATGAPLETAVFCAA